MRRMTQRKTNEEKGGLSSADACAAGFGPALTHCQSDLRVSEAPHVAKPSSFTQRSLLVLRQLSNHLRKHGFAVQQFMRCVKLSNPARCEYQIKTHRTKSCRVTYVPLCMTSTRSLSMMVCKRCATVSTCIQHTVSTKRSTKDLHSSHCALDKACANCLLNQ